MTYIIKIMQDLLKREAEDENLNDLDRNILIFFFLRKDQ